MNINSYKMHSLLFAAAALAAALSGCGTTSGYQQADKTGAGIAELRDEVINVKKAVDAALKSLDQIAVSATTDPRKAYEQFSKAVANVEKAEQRAKDRAETMRSQGDEYFKNWEKQLSEVHSPEVRRLAEERKVKLRATFDGIKTAAQDTKDSFPIFLADLKDLRTFLSNDLTVAGVDSARNVIAKSKKDGGKTQGSLDGLIAELNSVAAALTPAMVKK